MPELRTARRALRHATFLALCACATLAGCNLILGIDEQGPKAAVVEEAGEAETPDTGPPGRPTIERCSVDSDCVAPNACYTPHCDRVLGACSYALCEAKGATCSMGACNTQSFTCEPPSPYGFRTTTYQVEGVTSGCGPRPDSCVAGMFPFLFLGTNDTVVALRVDDLVAKTPTKVTVNGVLPKPNQLVASGRRIWVMGVPQGAAPPYRLALAAIDVPSDPTVREIRATTSFVSYPYPSAVGFAAPNGALFVTYNDATQGLPTMVVDVPITNDGITSVADAVDAGVDAARFDAGAGPAAYTMFRAANVPLGSIAAGSSGTRIVTYRAGVVNIVERAGTATASGQADQAIVPPFGAAIPPTFTQGPDGVVAMAAPVIFNNAPPDCDCITYARVQWLTPNAIATNIDQGFYFHAESYRNPPQPPTSCNSCGYYTVPSLATWIDGRSLLAAASLSSDRERTAVRLLTREPFTAPATRRIATRVAQVPKGNSLTDRIALSSSNGFGYLVLADSQGNNTTLSIFDPRCDVPDAGN
ncbi:MAG: hypothetical protein JST00_28265 [Deltaproteobacteria bacterium]|nr:hypothetical protein [Deltaproteobacteria bacterium]